MNVDANDEEQIAESLTYASQTMKNMEQWFIDESKVDIEQKTKKRKLDIETKKRMANVQWVQGTDNALRRCGMGGWANFKPRNLYKGIQPGETRKWCMKETFPGSKIEERRAVLVSNGGPLGLARYRYECVVV